MTQGLELRGAVLGKGYRLGRLLEADHETPHNLVHEGTHERIPGRFLIRLFPPESLSQPEAASRIQRGARVASLLRDPHAVQVLDCNSSGEIPAFVVIERVPGRSLAEVLGKSDAPMPLARVVDIVESLAAALAAAHQIGLVHGDLHPAHVILPTRAGAGQPAAKLSGFGWAKEWRAAAREPSASAYLAPEQESGKVLTLDERADQFGLATLAYRALTGRLPFPARDAAGAGGGNVTVTKVGADLVSDLGPPPALAELRPGVPAAVDEVLRRALTQSPADRFPSITELAAELREAARSQRHEDGNGADLLTEAGARADDGALDRNHELDDELDFGTPRRPAPSLARTSVSRVKSAEAMGAETDDARLVLGGEQFVPQQETAEASAEQRIEDDVEDDVDDDIDEPEAVSAPIADDARTQIVRSPFFEEPAASVEAPPAPLPAPTPRRGIPLGRPPAAVPRVRRSARLPSVRATGQTTNPGMGPPLERGRTLTPANWSPLLRSKWTVPAAMGAGVLVLIGATIWIGTRPTGAPPPRTVAVAPPPRPTPAPVQAAPIAIVPASPPPATASATPQQGATGEAQARGPLVARATPAPSPEKQAPEASLVSRPRAAPTSETAAPHSTPAVRTVARRSPPAKAPAPPPTTPTAAAKDAASDSPNDCSIRILSRPWAEVWIDGKNTGRKTPVDKLKVSCGTRKLELKRPDKDIEQMEMLQVVPGKPFRGNYELE